jgi:hypothetical protein
MEATPGRNDLHGRTRFGVPHVVMKPAQCAQSGPSRMRALRPQP